MTAEASWPVFHGDFDNPHPLGKLPAPPSWRAFSERTPKRVRKTPKGSEDRRSRRTFTEDEKAVVNAAIFLRRPILVEGDPGTGKSTIAYAIAHELQLGPVLAWPVRSRTTIADGTYTYDAIGRLYEANRRKHHPDPQDASAPEDVPADRFIDLGPLGTALYPHDKPRVLLIDELDKGDLDLPNDLLHVLENGEFRIPELRREQAGKAGFSVGVEDGDDRVVVGSDGLVQCGANFPIIVITSNRERDFPPAFKRRCLRLETRAPRDEALKNVLRAHGLDPDKAKALVAEFDARLGSELLATDQLLNAVYLSMKAKGAVDLDKAIEAATKSLDG